MRRPACVVRLRPSSPSSPSSLPCRSIGTEHEKLGYNRADGRRLTYEQIAGLLLGIQERFGWDPIMEGDNIIGLTQVGAAMQDKLASERVMHAWAALLKPDNQGQSWQHAVLERFMA